MFSRWVQWEVEWKEKFGWLRKYKSHIPKFKRFRHFNFIFLHYAYILFWTILGSVLLYSVGGLTYTNALYFASGASTQSGLNPVDVNTLFLYQQIVIVLIACITNPIWINTMVVFIRLYWFEKRFQNVVSEARTWRRSRTKSRTKSEARPDPDHDREERGVRGREIRVLRGANGVANLTRIDPAKDSDSDSHVPSQDAIGEHEPNGQATENAKAASDEGQSSEEAAPETPFSPGIMWADEVKPPRSARLDNTDRLPQSRTREENIAFLENQRKGEKVKLRVPGPRDIERGEVPHHIQDEDDNEVRRLQSRDESPEMHRDKGVRRNNTKDISWDDPSSKGDSEEDHHRKWLPKWSNVTFPHRSDTEVNEEDNIHALRRRGRTLTFASMLSGRSEERDRDRDPIPYLSYAPTVGRNSLFIDLTEEQREELGGVEYRALKTLAWILSIYYFGFHIFGIVCLVPWILTTSYRRVPEDVGQNPTWWGIFTPMSLFTDLGFTITPDSMISFQYAIFPLLLGSFLIVIGNTGFPCMLRFTIWVLQKMVRYGTPLYEELRFLLDHPRRCFTLLFPRQATWWLFGILVLLNAIDIIFFIILDLNDPTITVLPPGIRFVDGVFQAFSTRTAGFAVVNLADLHPAIQVSYLIMMYISIFPIAISIRRTNVYEEKSLGIYASPSEQEEGDNEKSYIGSHLRRQLSFDLWYVFLGLFIICIVEGGRLENTNDYAFTIFSVLFEIVSAYGTVGLSLGYPNTNTSFSAQFKVLSKLVIIAMQLRGRHRGLPYALDRAILLPSESLQRKEAAEAARRARAQGRTTTIGRADTTHASGIDGDAATSTGSNLGRRNSTGNMSLSDSRRGTIIEQFDFTRQGTGLRRIVSGALSAGPARRKHVVREP